MVEKADLPALALGVGGTVWGVADYMNGDLTDAVIWTAAVVADIGATIYFHRRKNMIPPTEIVYLSPEESKREQEFLNIKLMNDAAQLQGKVIDISPGMRVIVPPFTKNGPGME